jgi:hypothetical protein
MRLGVFVSVSLAAAALVACGGQVFTASLSPANEVPPVTTSTGTGTATGTLDGMKLTISGSYSNLSANPTLAHVHSGDAGLNGPVVFNLSFDAGTLSGSQMLTAEQVTALNEGRLYVNVHTPNNTGGEIRGQLIKQ